uniref:Uncharacterized protein n=1 Tax=Setaria italica TaxID=4555 RepID=A0A0Q3PTA9_SETIT
MAVLGRAFTWQRAKSPMHPWSRPAPPVLLSRRRRGSGRSRRQRPRTAFPFRGNIGVAQPGARDGVVVSSAAPT